MSETPALIKGDFFSDERGQMRFVNDFLFRDVKRFYCIKHFNTNIIRAWQGHKCEKKYFYPISGSFVLAWVKIDNFDHPSEELVAEYHILSAKNSEIVSVPKGYANGLKALEPGSEVMIFSDTSMEDSANDNIRFPADKWLDWAKF
jgi:dTDP-4-dehydrorhamnose 3,5-epimerase-like enzyme